MTMQLTHWPQRYVHWLSSCHHHHGLIAVKEGFNNYDLKHTFLSVLCLADNHFYVVYKNVVREIH